MGSAAQYLVLIDTGAKQSFIFGTNKRRANVGASELIRRVGTDWINEACKGKPGVATIISASGTAMLKVEDRSVGEDIIEAITRKALKDAPGLGVWGIVAQEPIAEEHTDDDSCLCPGCQLEPLHEELAALRLRSGHPAQRFPALPFTQPCQFTGLPAVTFVREAPRLPWRPAGGAFHAAFRAGGGVDSGSAIGRLHDIACKATHILGCGDQSSCPVQTCLNPPEGELDDRYDPVRNAGWIAIIHADGNGIGQKFIDIGRQGADATDALHHLSHELDEVTRAAVAAATANIQRTRKDGDSDWPPERWLLPLIVAGDDVTVICDGRLAFDFTHQFMQEFASKAEAAADEVPGLAGATASAGIVFIKPHHPFSDAYQLAEQLCGSAKTLSRAAGGVGAIDFHVLHDTTGRDLGVIRRRLVVDPPPGAGEAATGVTSDLEKLRLWAGPVLDQEPSPGVQPSFATVQALQDACAYVGADEDSVISRSAVHSLREALLRGGSAITEAQDRVVLRAGDHAKAEGAVAATVDVLNKPISGTQDHLSYIIDALALVEVLDGEPLISDPPPSNEEGAA